MAEPETKRFSVLVEKEVYDSIKKAADTRKRSMSGEIQMTLTLMYEEEPYLMDRITGIAISLGMNPATFIKKLVDDYEYQRLSQKRSVDG
jgi:hypothetical protein